MDKNEIIDYVMHTPYNTNPSILEEKLTALAEGGIPSADSLQDGDMLQVNEDADTGKKSWGLAPINLKSMDGIYTYNLPQRLVSDPVWTLDDDMIDDRDRLVHREITYGFDWHCYQPILHAWNGDSSGSLKATPDPSGAYGEGMVEYVFVSQNIESEYARSYFGSQISIALDNGTTEYYEIGHGGVVSANIANDWQSVDIQGTTGDILTIISITELSEKFAFPIAFIVMNTDSSSYGWHFPEQGIYFMHSLNTSLTNHFSYVSGVHKSFPYAWKINPDFIGGKPLEPYDRQPQTNDKYLLVRGSETPMGTAARWVNFDDLIPDIKIEKVAHSLAYTTGQPTFQFAAKSGESEGEVLYATSFQWPASQSQGDYQKSQPKKIEITQNDQTEQLQLIADDPDEHWSLWGIYWGAGQYKYILVVNNSRFGLMAIRDDSPFGSIPSTADIYCSEELLGSDVVFYFCNYDIFPKLESMRESMTYSCERVGSISNNKFNLNKLSSMTLTPCEAQCLYYYFSSALEKIKQQPVFWLPGSEGIALFRYNSTSNKIESVSYQLSGSDHTTLTVTTLS